MNYRNWHKKISFLLVAVVAFPGLCSAQLSSTNYQVDVYGVGEENAGAATSSQYQIDGATGSSFEDGTSVSNTAGESDAVSGSARTAQDTTSNTDPNSPDATIPEPSTQIVPESDRNQESGIDRGVGGVPKSSDVHESSDTSLGDKISDKNITNETPQETTDRCAGSLACYWWVFIGGLVAVGIFYLHSRRYIR